MKWATPIPLECCARGIELESGHEFDFAARGHHGFAGGVQRFKKNSGAYTAAHAALGGRTLKTGQSRWFVGYKKHTLRLWLSL